MGTSNFHNVNASKVFAVLMNYEAPRLDDFGNETEDMEYHTPECFEIDDFIDNMKTEAQEFKHKTIKYYKDCDNDPHELRSFESTPLFQYYSNKTFGDMSVTVSINCVIRQGYYEGGNLDWYVTYDLSNYKGDEIDFQKDFIDCSNMPEGMRIIQSRNAERWAQKVTDELVEIVEDLFTKQSMPLVVTARFSNGETHYSKAN
jgi:hypothetical protein